MEMSPSRSPTFLPGKSETDGNVERRPSGLADARLLPAPDLAMMSLDVGEDFLGSRLGRMRMPPGGRGFGAGEGGREADEDFFNAGKRAKGGSDHAADADL